jgi:hypothetical protein
MLNTLSLTQTMRSKKLTNRLFFVSKHAKSLFPAILKLFEMYFHPALASIRKSDLTSSQIGCRIEKHT